MSDRMNIVGLEETIVPKALLDGWRTAGLPETPQLGNGDSPIAQGFLVSSRRSGRGSRRQ